jgi:hypothetical protein
MAALGCGFSSVICSAFGMNFLNGFEHSSVAFVAAGCFSGKIFYVFAV